MVADMTETTFIDVRTVLVIAHIFGVAAGMGGAFTTDAMFFHSVKDRTLSSGELAFLKLGGRMVWTGLALLLLSGIGMFLLEPAGYLASTKFLAKMTVVLCITANGLVFHHFHIPVLERNADRHFSQSPDFLAKRALLIVSGAISAVSWPWAVILGKLDAVPIPLPWVLGAYFLTVATTAAGALLLKDHLLPGDDAAA